MKEVRRETCLLAWPTSIFLSSISMAWKTTTPLQLLSRTRARRRGGVSGADLGVGLRLCKLDLEVKHFCWRLLLLLLCRGFLLTGQISVHILQQVPRNNQNRTRPHAAGGKDAVPAYVRACVRTCR